MRGRGWLMSGLASVSGVVAMSGCVSMNDYNKMKAQNRNLTANKQAIEQELFDVRGANETLRARVDGLSSELGTTRQLNENMRNENQLLDESRQQALSAMSEMAGKQTLGDIVITSPKLPAPLHAAVRRFADAHPSEVVYDAGSGKVKWTADLLFPLGSDVVKRASLESLRGFTEILKSPAAADFEVIVAGFTDNVPIVQPTTKASHPTNWHLSAHRAISVASALQKFGYAPDRIGITGYGEFRPVAGNDSAAGRSQNRRVEIYIIPRGMIAQSGAASIDQTTK